jgi:hypothetical protein
MSDGTRAKNIVLSKAKFKVFCIELEKLVLEQEGFSKEHVDIVVNLLCTTFNFDPTKSTYNKERIERLMQETGKSRYELCNQKYYENNKIEIDKQNKERTRRRRAALKASKASLADELEKEVVIGI